MSKTILFLNRYNEKHTFNPAGLPTRSPKLSGEQNCHNAKGLAKLAYTLTLCHDWIEFTGEMEKGFDMQNLFLFRIEECQHGTAYFRKLYKVFTIFHGTELEFANLEIEPRPSFLSPTLCRVKLHNRFCYTPEISKTIENFCREFRIEFKNYTRLDFAIDFQAVQGFAYNVQKLLHSFAAKKIVCKGKSMKVHSTVSEYTGITFGSRSSGVAVTIYNKTKEMAKKSGKPWISELWEQAGFNPDSDVYRLEFSTKKPRFDIVADGGETYGNYNDLYFIDKIAEHVNFLYHRCFEVAINKKGVRFSRLQRYYMLPIDATIFFPQTSCIKPQSSNIKKTVIKNVVLEAAYLQKDGKRIEASYAWDFATKLVVRYSLGKWWDKNFSRFGVHSSAMSHFDILHSDEIKQMTLKQAKWNFN